MEPPVEDVPVPLFLIKVESDQQYKNKIADKRADNAPIKRHTYRTPRFDKMTFLVYRKNRCFTRFLQA